MVIILFTAIILWVGYWYYKAEYRLSDRNRVSGKSGEDIVAYELGRLGEEYEVRHDVRCGHAQIDHLVKWGNVVFVIETKKWKGRISGKKCDAVWKVTIGRNEYWSRNPVLQNEFHIRELKKGNDFIGCDFVNLVVFVENRNVPKLKGVIGEEELVDWIREYEGKGNRMDRVDKIKTS